MLTNEIDEGFKGLYDFFYLPIDIHNNCNVGYAFINFVLPTFILKFYKDFNGRRWNKFNSGKVF
jgi:protein phosphatase 1 regulatory subunit 42